MPPNSGLNNRQYYWWKEKKKDVHQSVFQYLQFLNQNQAYRQNANLRNMRLYGNFDLAGVQAYSYMRTETSYNAQNRVTLNVIQSMVDTVVSKMTKNKPKPTFLTDGGDFSAQNKAKKLTKFSEGQFHSTSFYEQAAKAFQDSCIFGTGAVKIYRTGNEIKTERVFIDEIKVDDSESLYGDPRQMHQAKFIHRDVLKDMFPEHRGAIETVGAQGYQFDSLQHGQNQDMVMVIESWHLPSGKNADDGKRAITIENQTLLLEDYNKDYFPFIFWRWGERPLGFFGQGISEQLTGIQIEINKILRTIQVSMHLVSIPKIFLEKGSKVVGAHLNNKIGGIIEYAGKLSTEGKLGSIPSELFSQLDRLYQRAFEIIGISQLSAQSTKPAGLDSGKALREFNDIESERFMSVGIRYEKAFIDASKIMIDIARDIAKDTDNFSIKVKGSKFLETIDWKDVDLSEDKYQMHVFPTSSLSSTPAGKLQDVQELMQAGLIGPEQGLKLLDFPDLEQFMDMQNAAAHDIDRVIEKLMEKGEYETPEPYQNLEMGIRQMQQAYLLFRSQNADEERLELLRRWIADAEALIRQAQEALAPPPAPIAPDAAADAAIAPDAPIAEAPVLPPDTAARILEESGEVAPTAVPEAPPTSDLLPT